MRLKARTLIFTALGLAALVLLALAFRPAPVEVETAAVQTGPLVVTTEEQGETRSRDRYVVAAPVAGRLLRVLLRDGDPVRENQVVATLAPVPLSGRERDELSARVAAAAATARSVEAQLGHVREDHAQAERESARLEQLFARGLVSRQQLEQAQNATVTLAGEVAAALYRSRSAEAELREARAGLVALQGSEANPGGTLIIRSPASGRVLRVIESSERVVAAGTPILVVGDLGTLEVMLEMLSSEAVRVSAGMAAVLEGWGGDHPLRARVRLVEPFGFTKISALGVEEKRTRVILDFVDGAGPLGDGYRVTGRIIVWSAPAVPKIPIAALFRCQEQWCVYAVEGGRAHRREVGIGHRNEVEAELLAGLRAGERVVRHPPNELADGSRVRERQM